MTKSKRDVLRLLFTVLLTVGSIVISLGIVLMAIHGPESAPAFALAYFLTRIFNLMFDIPTFQRP